MLVHVGQAFQPDDRALDVPFGYVGQAFQPDNRALDVPFVQGAVVRLESPTYEKG
jgi:hypothetical protein